MPSPRFLPVVLSATLLSACAPSPTVALVEAAVRAGRPLDDAPNALIVGASADRRFVAYASNCSPDGGGDVTLAIRDDLRGRTSQLGRGQCMPQSVRFSPDGQLAAFSAGDGVIRVFSARSGTIMTVSRSGERGFLVAFSPDSRWLVVGSGTEPPAAALDAWDADLMHHVAVAEGVFLNPFGDGSDSVHFSPDSRRILFLGDAVGNAPLGTLMQWDRARGLRTVIAEGVVISYVVSADFARVAYLGGVTYVEGQPPSEWLHGELVVRSLDDGRVERVVERDSSGDPQLFTPDGTLLYLVGGFGGPAQTPTLEAYVPGREPVTIDRNLFRGYAPNATLALSACGDMVAYVTAFSPERSAGELHVATVPSRHARAIPSRLVDGNAVPSAFGWFGRALVYLHDPDAPGTAVGTLSRYAIDDGARTEIARSATQVGLRIDGAQERVLYLTHWDADRATGDLQLWTPSAPSRLLAHAVVGMSLQLSPDQDLAGALTVAGSSSSTALVFAPLGGGAAQRIAPDVTSFTIADSGRLLYTTTAGLFGR